MEIQKLICEESYFTTKIMHEETSSTIFVVDSIQIEDIRISFLCATFNTYMLMASVAVQ
jgi:hypothetical protein